MQRLTSVQIQNTLQQNKDTVTFKTGFCYRDICLLLKIKTNLSEVDFALFFKPSDRLLVSSCRPSVRLYVCKVVHCGCQSRCTGHKV